MVVGTQGIGMARGCDDSRDRGRRMPQSRMQVAVLGVWFGLGMGTWGLLCVDIWIINREIHICFQRGSL